MSRVGACALLCLSLAGCAGAPATPATQGGFLSSEQATQDAVSFLRGETYGNSLAELLSAIKDSHLLPGGSSDCGAVRTPVWAFHVQSKYSGWLCLDAVTGQPVSSSLPFMRR